MKENGTPSAGTLFSPPPQFKQVNTPRKLPDFTRPPIRYAPLICNDDPDCIPAEWDLVQTEVKLCIEDALKKGRYPHYFHGPVGCGKTSAAACIYRYWPDTDFSSLDNDLFWTSAGKLLRDLVKFRSEGRDEQIIKRVRKASLFVLDDICRREMTEAQRDVLVDVLEIRRGKPAIYTGNHSLEKLTDAFTDERLTSRILSGLSIKFTGRDRRLDGSIAYEA